MTQKYREVFATHKIRMILRSYETLPLCWEIKIHIIRQGTESKQKRISTLRNYIRYGKIAQRKGEEWKCVLDITCVCVGLLCVHACCLHMSMVRTH